APNCTQAVPRSPSQIWMRSALGFSGDTAGRAEDSYSDTASASTVRGDARDIDSSPGSRPKARLQERPRRATATWRAAVSFGVWLGGVSARSASPCLLCCLRVDFLERRGGLPADILVFVLERADQRGHSRAGANTHPPERDRCRVADPGFFVLERF